MLSRLVRFRGFDYKTVQANCTYSAADSLNLVLVDARGKVPTLVRTTTAAHHLIFAVMVWTAIRFPTLGCPLPARVSVRPSTSKGWQTNYGYQQK